MEYTSMEVGKRYEYVCRQDEGCYVDIDSAGMHIIAIFGGPTEKEKKSMSNGSPLEIRLITMRGIMLFLMKFGDMPWMDAPYTPHLSKGDITIEQENGKGLATTIQLFDRGTGELLVQRLVGLNEETTKKIAREIDELKKTQFNQIDYADNLRQIYGAYTTKDLVKMSSRGCKIG